MRAAFKQGVANTVKDHTLKYKVFLYEHIEGKEDATHEVEVELKVSGEKKHWKVLHEEAVSFAVTKLFNCPFFVQWTCRKTVGKKTFTTEWEFVWFEKLENHFHNDFDSHFLTWHVEAVK